MPPWEGQGFRHFLPASTTPNENTTPPIHPAVMAPLLTWAMRFTDDFAEDIIAARAERDRLRARITRVVRPGAERVLTDLFEGCLATGTPIPATPKAAGGYGIAKNYLAGLAGTERNHAARIARRYRGRLPLGTGCPLSTPVNGRVGGRTWTARIDYHDVPRLVTLLQTACLIVVSYLSGMRPGEALNLKAGCCPQPGPDPDGAIRYEVHGDYYKGAAGADGLPAPDGAPRRLPWIVIAPVARAIAVAEPLAGDERLFPARPGIAQWKKTLSAEGANWRIAGFIAYANTLAAAHGLDRETIPDDPDGTINILRFRRTVAWHIARLPGGRIALATQYGHLRATITAEGYAGRSRHGLARIMDIETAHAAADYLADLADRISAGVAVSGPAAGRLIAAAKAAKDSFAGMVLTPRQVDALLTEPGLQVYDHPDAFLTCNYDSAEALCDPRRATGRPAAGRSPSLDRCRSECANIARTDRHLDGLRAEIARLAGEAASPLTPQPLRDRLARRAAALRDILERHQRTRTTH